MRKTTTSPWGGMALLLGALGLPTSVAAQPPVALEAADLAYLNEASAAEPLPVADEPVATAAPPETDDRLYAGVLPEEDLADERGGEYQLTQIGQSSETATQTDNTATGNLTGANWIGDSAFSGSDGFATAIQNSGNNVIIQNSLILNVTYAQ